MTQPDGGAQGYARVVALRCSGELSAAVEEAQRAHELQHMDAASLTELGNALCALGVACMSDSTLAGRSWHELLADGRRAYCRALHMYPTKQLVGHGGRAR